MKFNSLAKKFHRDRCIATSGEKAWCDSVIFVTVLNQIASHLPSDEIKSRLHDQMYVEIVWNDNDDMGMKTHEI